MKKRITIAFALLMLAIICFSCKTQVPCPAYGYNSSESIEGINTNA